MQFYLHGDIMSTSNGPKIIEVVDYVTDGSTWGSEGRTFTRMWQALIQPNVINITTSSPPGSPVNGDTYLVASGGSGAWIGKDAHIAYYTTTNDSGAAGWEFYAPSAGWVVNNQADKGYYRFNGTMWVGARQAAFCFEIDGGGSVPSTGAKGQVNVPTPCTIYGWVLTADQSGSAVVDVLKSTYSGFPTTASIASSDKPTLSSVQKNENLAVSVWTTALAQGDQLQINLNSVSTVTRLNLTVLVYAA